MIGPHLSFLFRCSVAHQCTMGVVALKRTLSFELRAKERSTWAKFVRRSCGCGFTYAFFYVLPPDGMASRIRYSHATRFLRFLLSVYTSFLITSSVLMLTSYASIGERPRMNAFPLPHWAATPYEARAWIDDRRCRNFLWPVPRLRTPPNHWKSIRIRWFAVALSSLVAFFFGNLIIFVFSIQLCVKFIRTGNFIFIVQRKIIEKVHHCIQMHPKPSKEINEFLTNYDWGNTMFHAYSKMIRERIT